MTTKKYLRQLGTKLARVNKTITEIERIRNQWDDAPADQHLELTGVLGDLTRAAGRLDGIIRQAQWDDNLDSALLSGDLRRVNAALAEDK